MGYITRFDLHISRDDKAAYRDFTDLLARGIKYDGMGEEEKSVFKEEYIAKLKQASDAINTVHDLREPLQWIAEGLSQLDEMKWYDHEDHMRRISAAFPEFLFELTGEGEDNSDGNSPKQRSIPAGSSETFNFNDWKFSREVLRAIVTSGSDALERFNKAARAEARRK